MLELVSDQAGAEDHWNAAYHRVGETGGSWFEEVPTSSLAMIDLAKFDAKSASLIDAGGGASSLVDHLLRRGWTDLTVLDVSPEALALSRERLGERSRTVTWVEHDVRTWHSARTFDLWHARAVFHFLVEEHDRRRYLDTVGGATHRGSRLLIGTFAHDGPETCSGLPVARYDSDALAAAVGRPWLPLAEHRDLHRTPAGGVQRFTWVLFERGG
ncbi:MAG: class I SAM-dependent methyltransferase [Sporichthyaceae bacterium]